RRGDPVHLYVGLSNFASEPRNGSYETVLTSTLEIRQADSDPNSKPIWYHRENPRIVSHALRTDHHEHYFFYLPPLPPGNYTLSLQVIDETRPEHRAVRKSLEFRVNSVAAARIP